ncbi:MAG: alpha amylase C-terminal domain-containing protein, partial [Oscillospiraceae bacterium]|nr:alpha amylase C-terminal domain-containing protein [Oscillospiraceae bacterium]
PYGGKYEVLLNSDDVAFGGSGLGDKDLITSEKTPCHGQEQSITVDLPPMSGLILRCARKNPVKKEPLKKNPVKKAPAQKEEAKAEKKVPAKKAVKTGSKAKKA